MGTEVPPEFRDRLARLHGSSANGDETRPARDTPPPDDLDWFLFHSFPEAEVSPTAFRDIVPVYERALRAGACFDFELLFVRLLELADVVGEEAVRSVARAAVARVLAGGFVPGDAISALRFATRALPVEDRFLDDVLESDALAGPRFHWTVDFVLDDRELGEYLALSYLRDSDPDTAAVLARFPVPAERTDLLAAFFDPDACRTRIEEGWERETDVAERVDLAEEIGKRLPGFSRGGAGSSAP